MNKQIETTLRDIFGFDDFKPGQRQVVDTLLAGRSSLAVFPTGGGKSLCFQLPALMLPGLTLVVSPLIALMKDQIDFLKSKNVRAERLDSSLTATEARAVWSGIDQGELKMLYVSPERFNSERFLQRVKQNRISLMVIDEAHCISEWGHNFRPDYLKLARAAKDMKVERVLGLTATATTAVAHDICQAFAIAPADYVNTGLHRPNLTLHATPVSESERDALLLDRLRQRPRGATIVYATLQKTAETVAASLVHAELPARHYHAGLSPEERHQIQDWFMASPDGIVVATIAFGMGVDKPDIRYVYHYNLPKATENYAQEIGRAGRDGLPAVCELFACEQDVVTLENFSYGDTPSCAPIRAFIDHLFDQPATFDISTYELSARFDIRSLVVSTLLCYLELDGFISATGPFYSIYKFQPLRPSQQILAQFDAARQRFIEGIMANSKKGRIWFSADLAAVSEALHEPRNRIVSALNYLEQKGDVKIQVAGLRLGYRHLKRADPAELARQLGERFQTAEQRDIRRIRQMLDLSRSATCLTGKLLDYFGEIAGGPCGHCDRCLGQTRQAPPALTPPVIPDDLGSRLLGVHRDHPKALHSPRAAARFLCGLSSPATSHTRPALTKHPLFGCLHGTPFAHVLRFAEQRLPAF